MFSLATLLDSEYAWLIESNLKKAAMTLLKKLIIEPEATPELEGQETLTEKPPVQFRLSGLHDLFVAKRRRVEEEASVSASSSSNPSKAELVTAELESFVTKFVDNPVQLSSDSFDFWTSKVAALEYPSLSGVAVDILCCPASTAAVERLFSLAGIACSGRRVNLSGQQLQRELMMQINKNYY